ncbi:MAG: energy-coupling factor transporter ATPase [Ruminococcaceae bacterium]|nr:energy-coupling factor transporter ATPase [Oscillospiraceae bacterium]
MELLKLEGVSCVYGKGTPFEITALDHVSVSFEAGKVTGVIGHTGSGKSTLVQMLNGILKPTEGRVLLDGKDIHESKKELAHVRFRVGLVMQYPEYQLFDSTVENDIAYGPRNMGLSEEEIALRVREAASFVGLDEELLTKSPFELSGGQKRRAAIAGVFAMRPEVLVLDEPAAGLDPRGKNEIFEGLLAYRRAHGATLILVSHSMEDMAKYCDNIVLMKGARVIKTGTVSEIFAEPALLYEAGLTMPAAAKIAERLLEKGIPLSGELYTVEGLRDAILQALAQKN